MLACVEGCRAECAADEGDFLAVLIVDLFGSEQNRSADDHTDGNNQNFPHQSLLCCAAMQR